MCSLKNKTDKLIVSSDIINGIFQAYGIINLLGKEVEMHNLEPHLKKMSFKYFLNVNGLELTCHCSMQSFIKIGCNLCPWV